MLRMRHASKRRGATLLQYGTIVGLIAVVALAATTMLGANTSKMFQNVSNRLSNVTGDGGSSTGGATAQAKPPCANNSTPIARLYQGATMYYLCRGARSYPLPAAAYTSCPTALGTWTNATSNDGATVYGAFRYETADSTTTASTTYPSYIASTCYSGSTDCYSTASGGGVAGSYMTNYANGVALCSQSFDNYQGLGSTSIAAFDSWYIQGDPVNARAFYYSALGGNRSLQLPASRIASYYMTRVSGAQTVQNISALTEKIWVEPAQ